MPLFATQNQILETSPYEYMANGLLTAQTLFISIVEAPNYSMTLSTMEMFFITVNAANPTIGVGIYAWNTAGTGALLASGTGVPSAAGFFTIPFSVPLATAPLTKYYFAYLNQKSADVTTNLACVGANTQHVQICATLAAQTTLPANLSSLSTTNGNRLVLRAYT